MATRKKAVRKPRAAKTKKRGGGRPAGEKTRCCNTWTEAKFKSFIKNNLRSATRKWKPIQECKRLARVRRGWYLCACCKQEIPASITKKGKRVNNAHVDHIAPIVDPAVGFTDWNDCIERMFCELDNLQLLCTKCHDKKSAKETTIASARRAAEKLNKE